MCPDIVEGQTPGNGAGPQEIRNNVARVLSPNIKIEVAEQDHSPIDRRTSTSGLSIPIRDVRIRLARNEIHDALRPVSRHAECALDCLELDDDRGLEHHLRRVVDDVRKAAQKHKELRALLSEPGREAKQ
jgi:hypothetical protein